MSPLIILCSVVLEVVANVVRQAKGIKIIQTGKESIELFLFTDDMTWSLFKEFKRIGQKKS